MVIQPIGNSDKWKLVDTYVFDGSINSRNASTIFTSRPLKSIMVCLCALAGSKSIVTRFDMFAAGGTSSSRQNIGNGIMASGTRYTGVRYSAEMPSIERAQSSDSGWAWSLRPATETEFFEDADANGIIGYKVFNEDEAFANGSTIYVFGIYK